MEPTLAFINSETETIHAVDFRCTSCSAVAQFFWPFSTERNCTPLPYCKPCLDFQKEKLSKSL